MIQIGKNDIAKIRISDYLGAIVGWYVKVLDNVGNFTGQYLHSIYTAYCIAFSENGLEIYLKTFNSGSYVTTHTGVLSEAFNVATMISLIDVGGGGSVSVASCGIYAAYEKNFLGKIKFKLTGSYDERFDGVYTYLPQAPDFDNFPTFSNGDTRIIYYIDYYDTEALNTYMFMIDSSWMYKTAKTMESSFLKLNTTEIIPGSVGWDIPVIEYLSNIIVINHGKPQKNSKFYEKGKKNE